MFRNWHDYKPLMLLILAQFFLAAFIARAHAHPHGWIEIEVELIFNERGEITALRQNWLQDEFNSAYNLEGTDKDGDGLPDPEELKLLAGDFMSNLNSFDYFTRVEQEGQKVEFAKGSGAVVTYENAKLRLVYDLPLKKPVSPLQAPLKYAVYDPTFYIEMLHIEGDKPVKLSKAPEGCGWKLVPPEPNADLAAYALALGPNESGGTQLGEHFAEWVTISCK